MKTTPILFALTLFPALASAQAGNWSLTSTYTYSFTGATASFHDIEAGMEGGSADGSYGWGSYSSFNGDASGGSYSLSFDTTPFDGFLGDSPSEPYLQDSFAFGVMDALPGDPVGQQHLVLFMNPEAASNVQNIAYGTIFGTSNQPYQYTEEDVINALEELHSSIPEADKDPYRTIVDNFRGDVAKNANVGPNGAVDTAWFTPGRGLLDRDLLERQHHRERHGHVRDDLHAERDAGASLVPRAERRRARARSPASKLTFLDRRPSEELPPLLGVRADPLSHPASGRAILPYSRFRRDRRPAPPLR